MRNMWYNRTNERPRAVCTSRGHGQPFREVIVSTIPHKRCSKCGAEKLLTDFGPRKNGRGGLQSACRECRAEQDRAYYYKHQEARQRKSREYWQRNPEKSRENWRAFASTHQEYNRQRGVRHYQENRERELAQYKEWAQRNKDHLTRRAKAYYRRTKQRQAELFREWSHRNPEQVRLRAKRRRARRKGADGSYTLAEWHLLCAAYDHRCLACGKHEPDIKLTADHVIPLSKGGSDFIDNIQPLCFSCNSAKNARTVDYRP